MGKLVSLLVVLMSLAGLANGQQVNNKNSRYWVYFKDKGPEEAPMLADIHKYLPEAMINAHLKRGLPVNQADLPVSQTYIDRLRSAGFTITGSSRWLNAVSVIGSDLDLATAKAICPAVIAVKPKLRVVMKYADDHIAGMQRSDTLLPYGQTLDQDTMINIQCLQNQGFTGIGVNMAILDDGFIGIDSCKVFDYLNSTNQVKARYNVTDSSENTEVGAGHGTAVASIIASNYSGYMIGTAFNANLYLVVAGSAGSGYLEEQFISAVEWAEDTGVDIIQSSLGYAYLPGIDTTGLDGYVYDSMNGHSPITRVAEMAVSKGIIFVNANGNIEGGYTKLWAPSDGDSVLAVGGVDKNDQYRTESSQGPTADGRIKPDIAALAGNDASSGYGPNCLITTAYSGTSFSAPLVSGMAACLKQAYPSATGWQIVEAIMQSGRQYPLKDTFVGYGIPNACIADSLLSISVSIQEPAANNQLKVYPVPAMNSLEVSGFDGFSKLQVWDGLGRAVNINYQRFDDQHINLDIRFLAPGIYLLGIAGKDGSTVATRFVKYN